MLQSAGRNQELSSITLLEGYLIMDRVTDAALRQQRQIQTILVVIILVTLPCYCVGAVLLATAPTGRANRTPTLAPTLGVTQLNRTTIPSITPFTPVVPNATPTPFPSFPTNTPAFLFPTNPPPVFPTPTPLVILPTNPPVLFPSVTPAPAFPTSTPIVIPTTPAGVFVTNTAIPLATLPPSTVIVPTTQVPPPTPNYTPTRRGR